MYDLCHGPLVKRSDDTEETFEKRYNQYLETSKDLIAYYEEKNQVYYIDAGHEKEIVFADIERVLENGK
ncbi:adenylate kinase [compost metagenome]